MVSETHPVCTLYEIATNLCMCLCVCMYVNFVSFCCKGRSGGVARGGEVTEQERLRIADEQSEQEEENQF